MRHEFLFFIQSVVLDVLECKNTQSAEYTMLYFADSMYSITFATKQRMHVTLGIMQNIV